MSKVIYLKQTGSLKSLLYGKNIYRRSIEAFLKMFRAQLDLSTFFFTYMIAIFLSFLFFLISALLRHRRETRRLREKFRRLRERPEQPWFEETE